MDVKLTRHALPQDAVAKIKRLCLPDKRWRGSLTCKLKSKKGGRNEQVFHLRSRQTHIHRHLIDISLQEFCSPFFWTLPRC